MEKEFASFIELENQVERIIDLAAKLKEENQRIREENQYLQKKYQSLPGESNPDDGGYDGRKDPNSQEAGLSPENADVIRNRITHALSQLEQLRQKVMSEIDWYLQETRVLLFKAHYLLLMV